MKKLLPLLLAFVFFAAVGVHAETVSIVIASNAAPRVEFGAEKIEEALKAVKLDAVILNLGRDSNRKIHL